MVPGEGVSDCSETMSSAEVSSAIFIDLTSEKPLQSPASAAVSHAQCTDDGQVQVADKVRHWYSPKGLQVPNESVNVHQPAGHTTGSTAPTLTTDQLPSRTLPKLHNSPRKFKPPPDSIPSKPPVSPRKIMPSLTVDSSHDTGHPLSGKPPPELVQPYKRQKPPARSTRLKPPVSPRRHTQSLALTPSFTIPVPPHDTELPPFGTPSSNLAQSGEMRQPSPSSTHFKPHISPRKTAPSPSSTPSFKPCYSASEPPAKRNLPLSGKPSKPPVSPRKTLQSSGVTASSREPILTSVSKQPPPDSLSCKPPTLPRAMNSPGGTPCKPLVSHANPGPPPEGMPPLSEEPKSPNFDDMAPSGSLSSKPPALPGIRMRCSGTSSEPPATLHIRAPLPARTPCSRQADSPGVGSSVSLLHKSGEPGNCMDRKSPIAGRISQLPSYLKYSSNPTVSPRERVQPSRDITSSPAEMQATVAISKILSHKKLGEETLSSNTNCEDKTGLESAHQCSWVTKQADTAISNTSFAELVEEGRHLSMSFGRKCDEQRNEDDDSRKQPHEHLATGIVTSAAQENWLTLATFGTERTSDISSGVTEAVPAEYWSCGVPMTGQTQSLVTDGSPTEGDERETVAENVAPVRLQQDTKTHKEVQLPSSREDPSGDYEESKTFAILSVCNPVRIASTVAVIIALLLMLKVYTSTFPERSEVAQRNVVSCTDMDCTRISRNLRSSSIIINRSISACDHFYERVCYTWTTNNSSGEFADRQFRVFLVDLKKVLMAASEPAEHEHDGQHSYLGLYKSCIWNAKREANLSEDIGRAMSFLGAEAFLKRSSNWKSVIGTLLKLCLFYGINGLFVFSFEPYGDRLKPTVSSEHSPITDSLPLKDAQTFLKVVVKQFPDLLTHEEEEDVIGTILGRYQELTTSPIDRYEREVKHALVDVLPDVTTQDWLTAINAWLPEERRLRLTSLIVVSQYAGGKLRKFLTSHPDIARLYINSMIVTDALRFNLQMRFKSKPLEQICFDVVRKNFPHKWANLAIVNTRFDSNVEQVELLFGELKKGLLDELLSSAWMDNLSRIASSTVVNKTSFRSYNYSAESAQVDYRLAPRVNTDAPFIESYLKTRRFATDVLNRFPLTSGQVKSDDFLLQHDLVFSEEDLDMTVPALLTSPDLFFAADGEQFHNFATLGVLMVLAFFRSDAMRTLLQLDNLRTRADCQVARYDVLFGESLLLVRKQESLREVAVRAAYRSLERYSVALLRDDGWQDYKKGLSRFFFERYCLLSCGVEHSGISMSGRQRCLLPLLNMEEFAWAFDCPLGVVMNSGKKCEKL